MSDLEQIAATIAAGIAAREPQHRPRTNQAIAGEAISIARCLIAHAGATEPEPSVPAVGARVDENPIGCNFYLVKANDGGHAWRAEFEISDKALLSMRPRGDRDALLRLLIEDALSGAIDGKDLG